MNTTASAAQILAVSLALLSVSRLSAATHYVSLENPGPKPPYTNWATAATVVQDAVDAAEAGDEIVVTNGVYTSGGRAVGTNLLVSRVAVDKPLTLRSVNGPQFTIIQGYQVPGTTNGDGAIRCVYLANGANLSGFTLTNGATRRVLDDWPYPDSSGGGLWCESEAAVVYNCVLAGNSAWYQGGGGYSGTLNNCTLTGNSAFSGGGGACGGALDRCVLSGNSAYFGGGASDCTLNHCTLTGNSAFSGGGGASGGTLQNCMLNDNVAMDGGGAEYSTLIGCSLAGNSADDCGGGACGGSIRNCTLTGNCAGGDGGGAFSAALDNCIVYHNYNPALHQANYDRESILNHCCTTPLPKNGANNMTLEPQLASVSHLSATSPCRGAGSAAEATGTDIDGEAWANPPSIGCDEYKAGLATGPLAVELVGNYTNVPIGYPVSFIARIVGRTTASAWDFGDGVVVTNRPYATHAWAAPADYTVVLWAYNESFPAGVSASLTIHALAQPVHYVVLDNANPLPPYTSWATAATSIQDAVDAASLPGALVLVSNGVYAAGGRAAGTSLLVNRVGVEKPLTLRSVNGPQFTIIQGYQVPGTRNGSGAIRCAYLASGASLSGFTLTNGATHAGHSQSLSREADSAGGGVCCASETAVVTNCVLIGNCAGDSGGGASRGTLNRCTLSGNWAASFGGGASDSALTLNSCTLTGNSATYGGGACYGILNHCTLTGNSGMYGGAGYSATLNDCNLTGNSATYGGGACYGILNRCTLAGNSAGYGGGATSDWVTFRECQLNNCILTGNSATYSGGGAFFCSLNNCTLTGNSADVGGGAAECWGGRALNNCIVYSNSAPTDPNYYNVDLNYSCTTPLPTNGVGNIAAPPLFVDDAGGNLRLESNSPCINAGLNAYAPGPTDLDGNSRIVSGTVDIGAYEYQGAGSMICYAWLQQYGLPIDGSADFADPDHDGQNNWQEWRCLTDPTNALSVLRLLSAAPIGTNATVTWQSVAGVIYFLERSTNLSATTPFTPLAINLPGQPGTTTYTDTNAARLTPLFYRVGVGN